MPNSLNYRRYSLRNKLFWGFILMCVLSVLASAVVSFVILRNNAYEQNLTQMQKKSDAMMAALDYAVSHTQVQTQDLPQILENEIFKISDINKQDIILYDLSGTYLLSNKEYNLIPQKKIPLNIVNQILGSDRRIDISSFDQKTESTVTSSYMVLKNNMLEPIAIVYFPYYHNEGAYLDVLNRYMKYVFLVDVILILFSIWLSWIISKNLTNKLTQFAEKINRINFFEKELRPIKYYNNDELGTLVKAYNRMILQIQEQKERLSHQEREHAWREMAKQIAHEVKNPLTPMKLTIQNFERKFDANDPNIQEKVSKMSESIVDQIDLIASVAGAFSEFAQLPEKNNEAFNLTKEIASVINIFNESKIFLHSNRADIMIHMDRNYLNRIITNLVSNAIQAEAPDRELIINIDVEQVNKRVVIAVEDNGTGISPDLIERIFEPSFTSKNSGMGLGLTMVRKMVEDYHGEISVQSEINKGTKFTISLPTNL